MADHKAIIIANLEALRQRDVANNDRWKARAYDKVLKQLKAMAGPVRTMDDISSIQGVGEKIHKKIEEIITTGSLQQVEKIDGKEVNAVKDLSRVFGIGPIRAKEMYETHGIERAEDLHKHVDILNDKQKMGLKYYQEFEKRIPRKEMEKHEKYILEQCAKIGGKAIIMGSFRRGAISSGDIDVLLTIEGDPENYMETFKQLVNSMKKDKYLVDDFASGSKKYNGVCKMKRHQTHRRIDIMYSRMRYVPFALLYFTGSQDFNIKLRSWALDMGYTLNEYGLKNTQGEKRGQEVVGDWKTEEDVFEFFGLEYISPEKRENVGDLKKYQKSPVQ
jgi:DNA polymerase beta